MENEIWKVIDGYNGTCEVSSYGRFRRKTPNGYRYIKPLKNGRQIRIKFNFEGKSINIKNFDRLVAETFIDNPNNSDYVEHIDGNIENNHIDNLVWSNISYEEAKRRNFSQGKRKPNEYFIKDEIAYVKLNSNKTMICNADEWERVKHITWFYDGGYVKSRVNKKKTGIHRMIMNAPVGMEVDHINHNPLDNRKENLRICTHIVNMANRGRLSNNKNGINGVFFMKSNNRYYAQIKVNGENKYLGCFKTFEEARAARIRGEYMYQLPFIEEGTVTV